MEKHVKSDNSKTQQDNTALKKSEEKYRALFDNSSDAILLLKNDNSIFDANRRSCDLLGYSYDELTGMTVMDLHPPEEHKRARQLKEQGVETGSFRDIEDTHYRHKDGHLIPVSITATIVRSISEPMAIIQIRNITERRLAEQALRESEERFRSLAGNIPGIIYRCEILHPWHMEHISESIFDITGYLAVDFMESHIRDWGDLILKGDVEYVNRLVEESIAKHEHFELEYRIRHADGSFRWVHDKGVPLYDEKGAPKWLDGVVMDVTERKYGDLEREKLLEELATKNEELQGIVFVASHDLKTPLVNIQGFSGELVKTCEKIKAVLESEDTPPDFKEKLRPLLYEDVPEALHMNDMIKGVIASMQFQITNSGTEVTVGDLPSCRGDSDYINQVFSNLIANAVKYLHPDRKGRISISGEIADGDSVYCVADNGIGIAPENQKKIFEIFHRLENSHGAKGEGLGLTIALRILERQGGKIHIESEHGNGTKFFVSLPAI
jgi:PAS domain S-box-containing protein